MKIKKFFTTTWVMLLSLIKWVRGLPWAMLMLIPRLINSHRKITAVVVLVVSIYFFFTLEETPIIVREGTISKNNIQIIINENLEMSKITPPYKEVEMGQCYALDTNDFLYKDLPTKILRANQLSLREALTFSIPGREGKFYLTSEGPTLVCPKKSGQIKFSLDYPDVFTSFFAELRQNNKGDIEKVPLIISFKAIKKGTRETFREPRQIIRLNGLAGTLLPGIQVRNKYPDFDLDKEIGRK